MEAPALKVYTWSGDLVKTFDQEDLSLQEGDCINAVSPIHNQIIFMHIIQSDANAHIFQAYRLPSGPVRHATI